MNSPDGNPQRASDRGNFTLTDAYHAVSVEVAHAWHLAPRTIRLRWWDFVKPLYAVRLPGTVPV